uniref:Nickel/cobalt efflux system n=1 Tax=Talaromyces marneffei PM1 TaxID=1077442 RepID=A0A093VBJ1_TALMA
MAGSTCQYNDVDGGTNHASEAPNLGMRVSLFRSKFVLRAERIHGRIPAIKKIPLSAIGMISLIALINMLVWAVCGVVLHFYPSLISTAAISYSLGLRHALDADHISAIDLMTRRLLASGQKPVTVGTFFSLGHSTIVIITSIVVAATAAAVSTRFGGFSTVGGIIGTSVSAAFLILLGIMNAYILYKLVQQMRKVLRFYRRRQRANELSDDVQVNEEEIDIWKIEGGGFLFAVLKKMFVLIDRPWKMYPLGILFGLGFDTSSEIALLGISSIEATRHSNFWVILIFPLLFTAGMCLIDTTDGALMLSLYLQPAKNFLPPTKVREERDPEANTETTRLATPEDDNADQPRTTIIAGTESNNRDPIAFLYYSIVLTALTIIVALVIGTIQVLNLVLNVTEATGRFWDGVQTASDYYDAIGGVVHWTAKKKMFRGKKEMALGADLELSLIKEHLHLWS